jgi:glucosamine--fructose-6-phosphate aminotransferase (isomerizing)
MTNPGQFTHQEILSQPEAWTSALNTIHARLDDLRALYRDGGYEYVLFTGCGSTYYLSLAAAALLQEATGVYARAFPASEIWLYPRSAYRPDRRHLLVAVSRSGETTETLRAVENFRQSGAGDVLTLSCYGDRALASLGAVNLVLESGQEESVAQTRAFTVLYLATAALAGLWGDQPGGLDELGRLPDVGRRLLADLGDMAHRLGREAGLDRFYFLGSGPRYGLACELSLKMKEMSLSHSEPFTFMEFRHGPQSMVTPHTVMVGLLSANNRRSEYAVLDQMRNRGARILSMAETDATVTFDAGLSELACGPLYLPIGQLVAYERALSRNLNPDRPHNLDAVVRLEEAES